MRTGQWEFRSGPTRLRRAVFGHCSSLAADGMVYVAGGFDEADGGYSDRVFSYDPQTNYWTTETFPLNEKRMDHSCATVNLRTEMQV